MPAKEFKGISKGPPDSGDNYEIQSSRLQNLSLTRDIVSIKMLDAVYIR